MSKIKIKNFGPIREGFVDNDGWMDVNKVTVLIGDQGSGKSTVAKLISVFSWIEKNIVRNTISIDQLNAGVFKTLCAQQELIEYFAHGTFLAYRGAVCHFEYDETKDSFKAEIEEEGLKQYVLPKIQYVSAARNLLTILYNISFQNIVDNKGNIIDLASNIPIMVRELNKEYIRALTELAKEGFSLPINETRVYFQNHSTYIITKGSKVSMSAASSGVQSITPLLLVSHFLSNEVQKDLFDKVQSIDNTLKSKIENELNKENKNLFEQFNQVFAFGKSILKNNEDASLLRENLKRFISSAFINIVEEPEQNLFPTSQQNMLYKLLEYNNAVKENKLILTTHSPYVINYLMLAIKASEIEQKTEKKQDLKSKIFEIVPEKALTPLQQVSIYELDEPTGTISRLAQSFGLPSNENYLNNLLGETNMLFSELMEIEDLCDLL